MDNTIAQLQRSIAQLNDDNQKLRSENAALQRKLAAFYGSPDCTNAPAAPVPVIQKYIEDFLEYCSHTKKLSTNTIYSYRTNLKLYTQFLIQNNIQHSEDSIRAYYAYLQETCMPRSINCKTSALKMFLLYLNENDLLSGISFPSKISVSPSPSFQPDLLRRNDLEKMLSCARTQVDLSMHSTEPNAAIQAYKEAAVMGLLICLGLLPSELCSLKANAIDAETATLLVCEESKRKRSIPISDSVMSTLTNYQKANFKEIRRSGFLFSGNRGGKFTEDSVRKIVRKISHLAGLSDAVTPQSIRATFAVLCLEDGVDILTVQKFLGHTHLDSTNKYSHFTPNRRRHIAAYE